MIATPLRHCFFRLAAIASVFFALVPHPSLAGNLYSYDLESLIFMSEHVVRGRIGPRQNAGRAEAHQLTITRTFMGALQPGQSVQVAALDFFCKETFGAVVHVGEGDEVIAFLTRARPGFAFEVPEDLSVYMPLPSGLKLVLDGQVCDFQQERNPGGYILQRPGGRIASPNLAAFEKECAAAVVTTRPVAGSFIGPPALADIPRLLEILRTRAHVPVNIFRDRDAIAEAACAKLAELRDLPSLDAALSVVQPSHGMRALFKGYATPEGRLHLTNLLLGSRGLPPQVSAEILSAAITDAWPDGRSGWSSPADHDFLQRLARAILKLAPSIKPDDENAAAHLLRAIGGAAGHHLKLKKNANGIAAGDPPAHHLPALEADLAAALRVLTSEYPRLTSPLLRYRMDELVQSSDPALGFAAAESPPIAAYVRLTPPDPGRAMLPGRLAWGCEYRTTSRVGDEGRQLQFQLTLEDLTSRRLWPLGSPQQITRGEGGGLGGSVPLPADLPKSRYRLHPRFFENDELIFSGYSLDLDLP